MAELFPADPTVWFVAFLLAGAVLASISIWAPRRMRWKLSAVGLSAVLAITAYASLVDLLGRPKPVKMEWASAMLPEATVVATELREPEAIYLWLRFDDRATPRAYALPWSLDTARQLQQMMKRAEQSGSAVRVRQDFARSIDTNEPLFYVAPQEALPPKSAS